ncbi:unnamed protein product [Onchocerca flexuosa]|uniref:WH2 domain-containing protein n=1 Tax=Onchocerca flexuosa TaxID=387005 RepID=A0A183HA22_9BILA|nr:unnamed protein product [Onchocerca flexuosa]
MFFQSPRPFGQHSTSYRSMSNSIYSSSSMTNLQVPDPKSGRASAPPISFASVYEDSRFGPRKSSMDHTYMSNTNSEQTRISEESRFLEVIKNVESDRTNTINSAETSGQVSKNYEKRMTTSLCDSADLGGTSGHSFNIFQPEVHIPISKSNIFQVQHQNINQQPQPWVRQTQSRESQVKQTLQNLSPYHKEYHRSITSDQGNRFRSGSAVPFTEHVPKSLVIQSQPVPIYRTGGYASVQPTDEHEGFSEARVKSSAKFNVSQVPSNEQQQEQKPVAYQQLERRRNYATLHHVAPPKMGPFQRRTSDPSLLKINGNDLPQNIAMFNVAKGVRAELEQDPKFRKKADILDSRTATGSTTSAFSPLPLNEQPKQSPSLRQMKDFFEKGVQQFHNVLGIERPQPVPSAKPFNVEHVRSIFRTSNSARTESPPMATSMEAEAKQGSSLSEKTMKSLIKTHEVEEGICHAKAEDKRISGINSGVMIKNTASTDNAGTCSIAETNKKYMQAKPTAFVTNKPAVTGISNKCPEMRKEIAVSQEQPTVSQDIAVLEKDYNSLVNFAAPRRLNHPFPIDNTASISGSGKTQNTANPPGILMKDGNSIRSVNDLGMKTPKKVVFQCDTDKIGPTKNESKEYKCK